MPLAVKVGCALGVVGIAGLLGFFEAWRLKLRVRHLEAMLSFLKALETEIQFTAAPIGQIIAHHQQDMDLLSQCGKLLAEGAHFQDGWYQAVSQDRGGFTKQDRTYLYQFGEAFGKTDKAGQIAGCRLTIRRMEEQLAKAQDDVTRKARLYRSLGILCGAGVFCILV